MPDQPKRPALKLNLSGNYANGSQPASATPKITFKLGGTPTKRKLSIGPSSAKRQKTDGLQKIRLTSGTPITPIIKPKFKGRPPPRPFGVGYDSEASDREEDPAIEEEFILRMPPGEDCDFLRKAIEERKVGLKRSEGGADIWFKFFSRDGRRGVVSIRNRLYACCIVELPGIVEAMKSWDKRGWWKTGDICQMLLVHTRVRTEDEAKKVPYPKVVDEDTMQYAHGLTPPMAFARKQRFRKRVSNRIIEAVEDEVERLLAEDLDCVNSKFEIVDLDRVTRENSAAQSDGTDTYEEADDYFEEDFEADFEQAMMAEFDEGAGGAAAAETPAAESSEDDPDEKDSSDEDDEDSERQAELQGKREEIAILEAQIKTRTVERESVNNPILKDKLTRKILELKAAVELKRRELGEGDE